MVFHVHRVLLVILQDSDEMLPPLHFGKECGHSKQLVNKIHMFKIALLCRVSIVVVSPSI